MSREKQVNKTVIRHIVYAVFLMFFIFLDIYMYLKSNNYIAAFELKDIFFKGGTLDNLSFYDMRMTMLCVISTIIKIAEISNRGSRQ